jgi:hypothetical protein
VNDRNTHKKIIFYAVSPKYLCKRLREPALIVGSHVTVLLSACLPLDATYEQMTEETYLISNIYSLGESVNNYSNCGHESVCNLCICTDRQEKIMCMNFNHGKSASPAQAFTLAHAICTKELLLGEIFRGVTVIHNNSVHNCR